MEPDDLCFEKVVTKKGTTFSSCLPLCLLPPPPRPLLWPQKNTSGKREDLRKKMGNPSLKLMRFVLLFFKFRTGANHKKAEVAVPITRYYVLHRSALQPPPRESPHPNTRPHRRHHPKRTSAHLETKYSQ